MANGTQRRQDDPRNLHQQKVSSYTSNYEWQNHMSLPHRDVPWHDAGRHVALDNVTQKLPALPAVRTSNSKSVDEQNPPLDVRKLMTTSL